MNELTAEAIRMLRDRRGLSIQHMDALLLHIVEVERQRDLLEAHMGKVLAKARELHALLGPLYPFIDALEAAGAGE